MNYVRNYNRLSALSGRCLPWKFLKSYATEKTNQKLILEPLIEREIIRVKGDEVVPFLQGLMTNDIKHLHPSANKAIYAMFLNKAGRVMYDTILYSSSDPTKIFLECDKNVANDLQRHLKLYRVRRKIDIDSLNQEYNVWQAFEPHKEPKDIMYAINEDDVGDLTISVDPRLKQLGIRLLAKKNNTFAELSKLFKQHTALTGSSSNDFRFHRYNLGVAEGVVDMPPGKCFPLEANCDILNGVSFHKGCYIGQELTARVHHTGVIRKRHMPVNLTTPLPGDTTAVVKNEAGANCGTLYGSIADRALGLLRIENVIKAKKLLVNDNPCSIEIPHWWPNDLHSNILKNIRRDSKTN